MPLALLSVLAAALTAAVPPDSLDRARLIAAIDSLAASELANGPTAGLSIAVAQHGRLIYARGYGFANLEHGTPALIETVYKVGSITKQFTTVALLQLVERGKLDLDDDMSTFFPDFPMKGRTISIRQLLNHTSGIKSFTELGPSVERDSFKLNLGPERILALFRDQPPDFAPGTRWLYNNSAFYLVGLLIEKLSGETYADYLRSHIFEPLGMRSTDYCDDRTIVPHRARGYDRTPSGFANALGENMVIPFSAGGLCSTVLDLVTFRQALGSGVLITRKSYEQMIRPTVLANGWRTNYGFALATYRLGPATVIRHGGSISGFQANLMYVPEADLVVAALANTIGSDPVGVSDAIASTVLGLPLPVKRSQPLPPDVARKVLGRYRVGPLTVDITDRKGTLVLGPPDLPVSGRLIWQGGSTFLVRPPEPFGYYGSAVQIDLPIDRAAVDGFVLHTPFGEEIRARRVAP